MGFHWELFADAVRVTLILDTLKTDQLAIVVFNANIITLYSFMW